MTDRRLQAAPRADFLSVALKPSHWQYLAYLSVHAVVFALVLLAHLPVGLQAGLVALVVASAVSLSLARWRLRGPFSVQALICDATHQWHIQRWHELYPMLVTLQGYRLTPFGVSLVWVPLGRPRGLLQRVRASRIKCFVSPDQLSEPDYRWLKVLIMHTRALALSRGPETGQA